MSLELLGVALDRPQRRILDGISFRLDAGSTGFITGETGAGKTSLLRVIAGLMAPTSGTIAFEGNSWTSPGHTVPSESRSLGMVFQDLALWPHLPVAEQINITLHADGRVARRERTAQVLDALGLAEVAGCYPAEISGGQQQRVAIGRAMARRPRLALLDEPTNQLDRSTADHVSQWLHSEQIANGSSLLVVTHDMEIARMLGVDKSSGTVWTLADGKLRPCAR